MVVLLEYVALIVAKRDDQPQHIRIYFVNDQLRWVFLVKINTLLFSLYLMFNMTTVKKTTSNKIRILFRVRALYKYNDRLVYYIKNIYNDVI